MSPTCEDETRRVIAFNPKTPYDSILHRKLSYYGSMLDFFEILGES